MAQFSHKRSRRKTEADGSIWEYSYYGNGMLRKVVRPDKSAVIFKYDGLGRRIEKSITRAGGCRGEQKAGSPDRLSGRVCGEAFREKGAGRKTKGCKGRVCTGKSGHMDLSG